MWLSLFLAYNSSGYMVILSSLTNWLSLLFLFLGCIHLLICLGVCVWVWCWWCQPILVFNLDQADQNSTLAWQLKPLANILKFAACNLTLLNIVGGFRTFLQDREYIINSMSYIVFNILTWKLQKVLIFYCKYCN